LGQRPGGTATSNFGVGRRESHDASAFYGRFTPPELSEDETVRPPSPESVDRIHLKDARKMDEVEDSSVALIVTSPPYFAGKEYEEALGEGHVPATYLDYLELLHEVFRECTRKLEPGGRIAVNVANLGRKPYRSLSADVITILQDRLSLLLRGEIIWIKGKGAGNSTAWGSFQSPANPVLRDLTERVIVASKGRFDRALSRRTRAEKGIPSEVSIFKDEFMDATTDVWDIPPESANRVGHPAPFPVELPQRLIELYTYRGDLVLDPFVGSGSTAVAAVRTGRTYTGYDTDDGYIDLARRRVEEERTRLARMPEHERKAVALPAVQAPTSEDGDLQSRAVREGRSASEIAAAVISDCGFKLAGARPKLPAGLDVDLVAEDDQGGTWFFDVCGTFAGTRTGLRRTDTLYRMLGKAAAVSSAIPTGGRLVLLATELPAPGSSGDVALRGARGRLFFDAVEILSPEAQERLRTYAKGDPRR
jgi:DNA modification methylase